MKKIFHTTPSYRAREAMSRRRSRAFFIRATGLVLLAALVMLAMPPRVAAGVIVIQGNTYSLDGGQPMTGMWEIAEKIAYAKDAAIIVLSPDAAAGSVQSLLRLLESLKVPTILTKKNDYKYLVEHGVLRPTKTP